MTLSNSAQNKEAAEPPRIWAGEHNNALAAFEKQVTEARLAKEAADHQMSAKPSLPKVEITNLKKSDSPGDGHNVGREHVAKPKPKVDKNADELAKLSPGARNLVIAINNERRRLGKSELKISRTLTDEAQVNNNAMKKQGMGHHTPLRGHAEVVAMGGGSANNILNMWLNSPRHKAIIMANNAKYIGVARDGNLETARVTS